jgi:hypothetical protein
MEFSYGIYDADGSGVTGSTDLTLKIRRQADDYLFDFNTTTFKGSGWTTVAATMTQISAANLPGEYKYTVSVLGFDDGMYNAYFIYDGDRPFVDSVEFGVYGGYGIDYNAYQTGGGGGGGTPAADTADAVLDEPVAEHQAAGTLGKYIADILGDTDSTLPALIAASGSDLTALEASVALVLEDTNEVQSLISGSKIAAQVKGIDANCITASSIAADAIAVMTLLGSEYVCANLAKATAAVAAQGIDDDMVTAGVIQYATFKVSKSMNFQTPDLTFYLLYHYDASGKPDMRKPSLTTTW